MSTKVEKFNYLNNPYLYNTEKIEEYTQLGKEITQYWDNSLFDEHVSSEQVFREIFEEKQRVASQPKTKEFRAVYTAQDSRWISYHYISREITHMITKKSFFPMKFPQEGDPKNAPDFIKKYKDKFLEHKLNDSDDEMKRLLTSISLSLTRDREPYESAAHFYRECCGITAFTKMKIKALLIDELARRHLDTKPYREAIDMLVEKAPVSRGRGIILQIFIDKMEINNVAYSAKPFGYPFSPHPYYKLDRILNDANSQDKGRKMMKLFHHVVCPQGRVVAGGFYKASMEGKAFFSIHSSISPDEMKKYEENVKGIFNQIKEEDFSAKMRFEEKFSKVLACIRQHKNESLRGVKVRAYAVALLHE